MQPRYAQDFQLRNGRPECSKIELDSLRITNISANGILTIPPTERHTNSPCPRRFQFHSIATGSLPGPRLFVFLRERHSNPVTRDSNVKKRRCHGCQGSIIPPTPLHLSFSSPTTPSSPLYSVSSLVFSFSNSPIRFLASINTSALLTFLSCPFMTPSPRSSMQSFGNACSNVSNCPFNRLRYCFSTALWFVLVVELVDAVDEVECRRCEAAVERRRGEVDLVS